MPSEPRALNLHWLGRPFSRGFRKRFKANELKGDGGVFRPSSMLLLLLLQATTATIVSADASCLMQTGSPDRKALPQGSRLRTGEAAAAPKEALQQLAFSARGLVETLATLQRRLRHRELLLSQPPEPHVAPVPQANATAQMPANFISKYQRLSPNKTLVMWVVAAA
eukprot:s3900_g5.t1